MLTYHVVLCLDVAMEVGVLISKPLAPRGPCRALEPCFNFVAVSHLQASKNTPKAEMVLMVTVLEVRDGFS